MDRGRRDAIAEVNRPVGHRSIASSGPSNGDGRSAAYDSADAIVASPKTKIEPTRRSKPRYRPRRCCCRRRRRRCRRNSIDGFPRVGPKGAGVELRSRANNEEARRRLKGDERVSEKRGNFGPHGSFCRLRIRYSRRREWTSRRRNRRGVWWRGAIFSFRLALRYYLYSWFRVRSESKLEATTARIDPQ